MLAAIGAPSVDSLFSAIPDELRFSGTLDLPRALGEIELDRHLRELAGKNASSATHVCFLGGGSYDHFIPAAVDTIGSRSEFYTSYTPYQAEVAQGNLQAMFEYQSMVTRLTGLDVSNSSLYDGGSAAAEAVLMALDVTKRTRVVMLESVHPEFRLTIETYLKNLNATATTVATPQGTADVSEVLGELDDSTACLVVQHPNFFGSLEEARALADAAHEAGAVVIAVFDPISLGLLERPGDWGADIAVAEGQSLGSPMAYGGPYLGILACRQDFVRRMPGRIVGQTTDRRGNPCFVLTLQTREQHIRRDKSTSNVCSNQALFALRATVYLSLIGSRGLREIANLCLQKSHYLASQLAQTDRFEMAFATPTFKEFVVRDRAGQVEQLVSDAAKQGFLAGIPLGQWYPWLDDCMLVCVTEKRTRAEMDRLVEILETGAAKATADELLQAGI
jgi:glycine dehydrogenase subunit 1